MRTLYALATGAPPTAIAIVRIAGPAAFPALAALTGGRLPPPGAARLRPLRDPDTRELLDHALVLRFEAARSATGHDTAELHLHGSPAVVIAVLDTLSRQPGLSPAEPGAFARAAFAAGRLDLTQVEALADLAGAETPQQRLQALAGLSGALGGRVRAWRDAVLGRWAEAEAALDFAGEDPGIVAPDAPAPDALDSLATEMQATLAASVGSDRVRNGVRLVLTGPPNTGKSSLLNALAGLDRAIVSPEPGTTRDTVEAAVVIAGVPVTLVDTAGVRETGDTVEAAGVARARAAAATADLILDLTPGARSAGAVLAVASMADLTGAAPGERDGRWHVSARSGAGLAALRAELEARIRSMLPGEPVLLTHARQRREIAVAVDALREAAPQTDPVLRADRLRAAALALGRVTGDVDPEAMLDGLFARFCIGK